MNRTFGTWLIVAGLVLAGVGVLASLGGLRWFGRLPGDIRTQGENVRFFAPITSMIVVSVVLTVLVNLFGRGR